MLKKGMGDFCQQMLQHNAPLRLQNDTPVIGRFYPRQCIAPESDDLSLQFAGVGYAYTNVTQKMTFQMQAQALYRYDFLITDGDRCDVYAYFRTSSIGGSDFKVHRIESQTASMMNSLTQMGDTFGKQLMGKKLQEGFTVVHYTENNVDDFTLGILPLGQKPFHPYQVHGKDKITYENERVEVFQNQRDFVGPIVVEGDGRALFVAAQLDGAPAIDVLLFRKMEAEAAINAYLEVPQAGALPSPPIAGDVLQQGVEMKRAFPVAPGTYYILFDNTPTAGTVSPPGNAFDNRAAVVNYLIQIGDAS